MADEERELDSWLAGLRDGQGQGPSPPSPMAATPPEPPVQAGPAEEPQEPPSQTDMLDDLREQIILTEEEVEPTEMPPLVQFFLDMHPWQRLVLAVLLFLDVGMCGCMGLVMTGRVVFPFQQ
jgi:hypothetical protein